MHNHWKGKASQSDERHRSGSTDTTGSRRRHVCEAIDQCEISDGRRQLSTYKERADIDYDTEREARVCVFEMRH